MKAKEIAGVPSGGSTSVEAPPMETEEEARVSYERLGKLNSWLPYTFEHYMMKGELLLLRPWDLNVANSKCWADKPWHAIARVRLYIHEVYILCKWRRRDKNVGPKNPLIHKPDCLHYTNYYWDHLMVAQHWVNREFGKVKAMEDGPERDFLLHGDGGIVFHQEWVDQLLKKFRETNAAEAAEAAKAAESDCEVDAESGNEASAEEGAEDDANEDTEEDTEVDGVDGLEDTFEDAMEE